MKKRQIIDLLNETDESVIKDIFSEADRIRTLFETVLVLGGSIVADEVCSFALNSLQAIQQAPKGAKVELKVDTGMHRNGIALHELNEALALIKTQGLHLVGVMTHYRSSDELSSEFFWQKKQFEVVKKKVKEAGFIRVRAHSHNSAAILRTNSFDEDLVRVGIAAYGYNELPVLFDALELKPVLSLYAKKVATRVIKAGERIGYGGDFIAPQKMQVSTYDIGYGDGWCRGDAAQPYVTSEGLPILGRVSMDLIALESDKSEVCIMNDAKVAAKQFKTISYEVTTALASDIAKTVI